MSLDTNFVEHYFRVMKNVTITLDEETARWARVRAAEENTSVSRLVGQMLREKMQAERSYEEAMQRYLALEPVELRKPGESYPSREELYDRAGLR